MLEHPLSLTLAQFTNTHPPTGEKLSKTQLKLEAVVKKLRVEEKNNAKIMATLQERLSAAESLVESKTERIKELEATHSQYSGISCP